MPKYSQKEKPTPEMEELIKKLINILVSKGYMTFCVKQLAKEVLDYIGRPVIPYIIDSIHIRDIDKGGIKEEGLGWEGSDFLSSVSGCEECDKLEIIEHIKDDSMKSLEEYWKKWWSKNEKSFIYEINKFKKDESFGIKRRVDPEFTPELEKKIKLLIEKLGSKDEAERMGATGYEPLKLHQ